jgi:hypothetical protein
VLFTDDFIVIEKPNSFGPKPNTQFHKGEYWVFFCGKRDRMWKGRRKGKMKFLCQLSTQGIRLMEHHFRDTVVSIEERLCPF